MWDTLIRDLRQAARGFARNPAFTLVAVLTLAIGTGATTAVFSVVDGVLLKPLPYPEPDELVAVWHDAPGAPGLTAVAGGLQMSPSMMVTYQDESRSFEQVGIWASENANVTGFDASPSRSTAVLVTSQTLAAFGVPPLLGRWVGLEDEDPNGPPVTMLSLQLLAGAFRRRSRHHRQAHRGPWPSAPRSSASCRAASSSATSQPDSHRAVSRQPCAVDPAAVLLQRHRAPARRRHARASQCRRRAHVADLDRAVSVSGRRPARPAKSISTPGAWRPRCGGSRTTSSAACATCCGSSWR